MSKTEILDGAMGSEFIRRGINLPPYIWSSQVNLDASEIIYRIHQEYINAGADYITTNTFRTTPRAYKKIGLSDSEAEILAKTALNNAVSIAKKARSKNVKILGSIAPLEDCYRPDLFPGMRYAEKEFSQISKWFYQSNIDIFLIETMNNLEETQACLKSIREHNLPIWVSFVLLDDKHILSGESLEEAIKMLEVFNVDSLLINCNPLNKTKKSLKVISENWSRRWGIYPNLGIGEPNPDGIINTIHSDEEFIDLIKQAVSLGATLIGGCCGSRPKHIKLIRDYLSTLD